MYRLTYVPNWSPKWSLKLRSAGWVMAWYWLTESWSQKLTSRPTALDQWNVWPLQKRWWRPLGAHAPRLEAHVVLFQCAVWLIEWPELFRTLRRTCAALRMTSLSSMFACVHAIHAAHHSMCVFCGPRLHWRSSPLWGSQGKQADEWGAAGDYHRCERHGACLEGRCAEQKVDLQPAMVDMCNYELNTQPSASTLSHTHLCKCAHSHITLHPHLEDGRLQV